MSSQPRNQSKLARKMEIDLLEEHKHLTQEERLEVFLNHNRLMAQLQEVGERLRESGAVTQR